MFTHQSLPTFADLLEFSRCLTALPQVGTQDTIKTPIVDHYYTVKLS